MFLSKKLFGIAVSLVIATLLEGAMVAGFYATGAEAGTGFFHRLFVLGGGNFVGGGYIQWLTFFAFFWSMFEIRDCFVHIELQKRGYRMKLLPTNDKIVLMAQDVMEILVKAQEAEKTKNKNLVTNIVKKACTKFRTSKNISEMIEIISIQTEIDKNKSESDQSNIRYLTWLIPSVGFIGTVLGISQALTIANSGDMNLITSTLGVAFDTTLVALILSIIVMWFYHRLQEETDRLHDGIKEYVIENLVNRVEA